jgi:hypothetical protein
MGTCSFLAALGTANAATLSAQCTPGGPPNPSALRGSIVGIVMDTAHDPIEGATVFIRNPNRSARTNAAGLFRIDSLLAGTYELTVRRIGHDIAVQSYTVTDTGGIARFCLIPDPRGLAPMITAVKRGGLGGVVGDSTYKTIPGVEIRAVAGGARAITDSAGGFYLPLKPGTYALMVKKEGFGSQLISVTVPSDSGRQIAIWLSSPPKNARRIAAAIEDSMKFRLMFARAASSKLLSSEDIMKNPSDILLTVQAAAVTRVSQWCEAVIDGGPYKIPLYAIDKSEIAVMEVYNGKAPRGGATSIEPRGTMPTTAGSSDDCNVRVYVWLKP